MLIDDADITFVPVQEDDFEDFRVLHKRVMKEPLDRWGWSWNEDEVALFQQELFDTEGLFLVPVERFFYPVCALFVESTGRVYPS
ncbi:MAG: hypothetical protein PHS57_07415 [Alphaproteobacteria bacterium]|nr:hypothetical protein [Alphaproteobacteria bacterium]